MFAKPTGFTWKMQSRRPVRAFISSLFAFAIVSKSANGFIQPTPSSLSGHERLPIPSNYNGLIQPTPSSLSSSSHERLPIPSSGRIAGITSSLPDHGAQNRISKATSTTAMKLSPHEIIEAGVSFDTFAPQFLWILLIGLPQTDITKKLMGSIAPIVGLALVHLTIVVVAAAQEGALEQVLIFQEVFDPSMSQLAGMQKLFEIPNFVAEEWPHVLIWDLFVGRLVWIDGLERGINTRLSLTFCNLIGPPGLLLYVVTCLLSGKGLPSMGYNDEKMKK